MTRLDAWVDRHGWQIVIGLVSIGAMYATNMAALSQKADKSSVERMAARVARAE